MTMRPHPLAGAGRSEVQPDAAPFDWAAALGILGLVGCMFPVVPRAVHQGSLWASPVRVDTGIVPGERDWWMDPTDADSTTHMLAALAALGMAPLLFCRLAWAAPSTSRPTTSVVTAARFRPTDTRRD